MAGALTSENYGAILAFMEQADKSKQKRNEWAVFLFLAVFLAPILAVSGIGGYGLLIWLSQMLS